MNNYQLILDSNNLCIFCLCKVAGKECKNDLFPLHHLTSKMGINLGNALDIMTVPGVPHPDLDRMEVLVDACAKCTDICEEVLYKFQDEAEMENCLELLYDKMEKAKEDECKNCWSRLAIIHEQIVDRVRKEIIEKFRLKPEFKSNQSGLGIQGRIPKLLDIPCLPFDHICSYLSLKDIKNCSTVSKDVHRLVFPSLINSSFISFEKQSQLAAMIDFVKTKSNQFNKNINLFIKSKSIDDSSDGRSALLLLFQECGLYTSHLKLLCSLGGRHKAIVNGFRDNSIPVLGCGNELLPCLEKLELIFKNEDWGYANHETEMNRRENQIKASLPFIKAVLENSPKLKELKLQSFFHKSSLSLFKLIGESAPRIDTLESEGVRISEDGLGYLQSLKLKKVMLIGVVERKLSQALTNFLESQRKSLKHFRFVAESSGFCPLFTFPQMESLEVFELGSYDYGPITNTEDLRPIPFNSQLPKLKVFKMDVRKEFFPTLFPLDAEQIRNVKVLTLVAPSYEKDSIVRAISAFKCLSKLEIPVGSYLDDCWKDLRGLEELTLHSMGVPDTEWRMSWSEKLDFIDKIFTGLHIKRHCSITNEKDIREHEEKYEKMETKKSLALLTRLRVLRLWHREGNIDDREQSPMLTDISCRLVLMKMESLKWIYICGYRPALFGVSKEVVLQMRDKVILSFSEKLANLELMDWGGQ